MEIAFNHSRLLGRLLAIIFVAAGSHLAGQSSRQESSDYPYVLGFRIYPYGSANFEGLHYQSDPESVPRPIRVLRGRPSGLYPYEGSGGLVLYRKVDAPLTAEEMASGNPLVGFREVARHVFTATSGERLVFLTPARGRKGEEDSEVEFSVSDMPSLPSAVREDELVFFNGTGALLAGLVGDEKVLLGPGLSEPVNLKPFYGERKVLVGLVVQYQDSVRVVLEHGARFLPDRRNLFVLMPPERENSFEILAFRIDSFEFPEDVQAAEVAAGAEM